MCLKNIFPKIFVGTVGTPWYLLNKNYTQLKKGPDTTKAFCNHEYYSVVAAVVCWRRCRPEHETNEDYIKAKLSGKEIVTRTFSQQRETNRHCKSGQDESSDIQTKRFLGSVRVWSVLQSNRLSVYEV